MFKAVLEWTIRSRCRIQLVPSFFGFCWPFKNLEKTVWCWQTIELLGGTASATEKNRKDLCLLWIMFVVVHLSFLLRSGKDSTPSKVWCGRKVCRASRHRFPQSSHVHSARETTQNLVPGAGEKKAQTPSHPFCLRFRRGRTLHPVQKCPTPSPALASCPCGYPCGQPLPSPPALQLQSVGLGKARLARCFASGPPESSIRDAAIRVRRTFWLG